MQLTTIGYEGASLGDFISTLLAAGVERVVDIREVAQSRRPGFSKNALRTALAEVDIDYHHIRQLGDPKHGREAARSGHYELFNEIYSAHIELPASRDALRSAVALATEKQSTLMCFERDPRHCHRSIVAQRMIALCSLQIVNLGVQPNVMRGARNHVGSAHRIATAY
jgi:uncharacterized protein (DUF488 family)